MINESIFEQRSQFSSQTLTLIVLALIQNLIVKAVRDLKFESRVETRVFENGTRETRDRDSGIFNFLCYVLNWVQKCLIRIDF